MSWAVVSLAADSSTSVQIVVTATQTITHDAYRAAADGNLSARPPFSCVLNNDLQTVTDYGKRRHCKG